MANELLNRGEVAQESKWAIEDVFEDLPAWESAYAQAQALIAAIPGHKGKLLDARAVKSALDDYYKLEHSVSRLINYAHMRRDEDTASETFQALWDRALSLMVSMDTASAFITPELLELPEETLTMWREAPEFCDYSQVLLNIMRKKPHTLSPDKEELLAMAGEMAESPSNIYSMLNDADLRFPTIETDEGPVELTQGRYIMMLENKNRDVRKQAFTGLYTTYKSVINTTAATVSSEIKKNIFYARARNYENAREASLKPRNIPLAVYDQLVASVNNALPALHDYLSLRKKLMKLDELELWDVYMPIFEDPGYKVPYEKACSIVLEGLAPLGPDYIANVEKAYRERWIDVYENRGKTSGAYMSNVYGTHPYILLNYQPTLDNIFTLAHEMGHAQHSYMTEQAQPYAKSQYGIFLAEVASTTNEVLLLRHLLKSASKEERLYLLNYYLEQFRGTVFRQTMFAEFELELHKTAESGGALTADGICDKYFALNERYFGKEVVINDLIRYEWARIPHFYANFYVYQYATGFSAAVAFAESILTEGDAATKRYKTFLSAGGSDDSIEILKDAGIDMTKPEPVDNALKSFKAALNEMLDLLS